MPRKARLFASSSGSAARGFLKYRANNTLTWIGRLEVKAFHAGLTNTFGGINGIPKAFQGCVVTIIVGHLVIQVLTMHVLPMFATNRIRPVDKPGAWDVDLLEIWPVFGEKCWPPK